MSDLVLHTIGPVVVAVCMLVAAVVAALVLLAILETLVQHVRCELAWRRDRRARARERRVA